MEIEESGAFRNLGPDPIRSGFWTVEVLCATGEWLRFEGLWASDEAEMRKRAAGYAKRYAHYTPLPEVARTAEYNALMRDIAIWGSE